MNGLRRTRLTGLLLGTVLFGALVASACAAGAQGPPGDPGLPGNSGLPGNAGSAGKAGLPGVQGIQGDQGPQGSQGTQGARGMTGPVTGAGMTVLDSDKVLGEKSGIATKGWGFAPEEGVLLTLFAPGVNGLVIAGGNATDIGTFSIKTAGGRKGFDLAKVKGLEAGDGYVQAVGSAGSITSASLTISASAK